MRSAVDERLALLVDLLAEAAISLWREDQQRPEGNPNSSTIWEAQGR